MKERRSQRIKADSAFRELSEDEWSDEDIMSEKENVVNKEKSEKNVNTRKQIRLITSSNSNTATGTSASNNITSTSSSLQIKLRIPPASSSKKRKAEEKITLPKDMDPEPVCPICLKIIIGDVDDINEHVDECIGPSSVINSSGTCTPITTVLSTESVVTSCSLVNVDEDDFGYGKSQFTEADVERLIKTQSSKTAESKCEEEQDIKNSLLIQSIMSTAPPSPDFANLQTALKSLLDRLSAAPKCSVCWDMLKMPAVASINCWHVCCEECWLRQLGTKRLCPHCSTITNPSDLRKVFF